MYSINIISFINSILSLTCRSPNIVPVTSLSSFARLVSIADEANRKIRQLYENGSKEKQHENKLASQTRILLRRAFNDFHYIFSLVLCARGPFARERIYINQYLKEPNCTKIWYRCEYNYARALVYRPRRRIVFCFSFFITSIFSLFLSSRAIRCGQWNSSTLYTAIELETVAYNDRQICDSNTSSQTARAPPRGLFW